MMADYTDLKAFLATASEASRPQLVNLSREALAAIADLEAERDALRKALDEALTVPYWGDAQDDLVRLSALTAPTTGG